MNSLTICSYIRWIGQKILYCVHGKKCVASIEYFDKFHQNKTAIHL